MKYEVSFEIINLNEITSKVIADIKDNPNIFACGLDTICKLMTVDLPIQNRNIAIRNILSFLRYIDIRLKNQSGTTVLPIDAQTMIEYFNRNQYKKYLALLKELKVISDVPYDNGSFYSKDDKLCKLYRVFNQYLEQDICLVIFNKTNSKIDYKINGSYNTKFVNTIKKVDIDIKAAIEDEIKNNDGKKVNSLRSRLNRVFSLYDNRFMRKGRKVDRIYHSLSNLSKISRNHLTIKSQKFYNIDIKNCQPLLLCYLLIKLNLPIDEHYLYDCQMGILYENFYEKTGNKVIDKQRRDEAKVLLYKGIYFDFKKTATNLKFKEIFPLTYSSLQILSKNQEELAGRLQNIEATIFNSLLPAKSKYYYTLFDAIYFTDLEDMAELFTAIRTKFGEYGIKPSVDINSDEAELDLEELIVED